MSVSGVPASNARCSPIYPDLRGRELAFMCVHEPRNVQLLYLPRVREACARI